MSSNELHITRANYVEYFLLYVDGELTPAQSDAVESFAALHLDLQEELDLLLTTKLEDEPVFFNKESLLADSMKHTVIDESLLLYIDNELQGEEKAQLEEKLQTDSTYQYQYTLLQQTKLVPPTIPYPNKEELYRQEEHKVRPLIWFRAAAAVFVLVAAGYMWQINQSKVTATSTNDITVSSPVTPADKNTPGVILDKSAAAVQDAYTSSTEPATKLSAAAIEDKSNNTTTVSVQQAATKSVKAHPTATGTDVLAQTNSNTDETVAITPTITSLPTPQHNINTQPVTITPDVPYNHQVTAPENPGINDVAATESDNNKKGTMKGFLRKATRFIERRTGVSTTNDDDELLIGAVAIKLK